MLKIESGSEALTDGQTDGFERDGIYMAMFSYFGYLCGYLPLGGIDTQETYLATKISNLRNKSHLYFCVCPTFITT